MALDKWQQRQAEQYAEEHGITYDEAVQILFPDGEVTPAAVEPDTGAAAPDGDKVELTK